LPPPPFAFGFFRTDLRIDGTLGRVWPLTATSFFVTPQYFATLRTRIVDGRALAPTDYGAHAGDAVVVSRSVAKNLFGSGNPIGRAIEEREFKGTIKHTVVGVAEDARTSSLRGEPDFVIYQTRSDGAQSLFFLLVRSARPQSEIETGVRSALASFDPALPVYRVEAMTESIGRAIAEERLFARLVGTLGLLATVLAAVGLYTVIAYSVAERTPEIGVRMALGARDLAIVGLIVRQAGRLVVVGLALGVGGAAALARVLSNRLFGVTALDPSVYAAGALALVLLAIAASAIPARAATRVDPLDALRSE
jgi:putative ABC transport system permease protein